jgi:ABC-type glutathione transport system ATPase component
MSESILSVEHLTLELPPGSDRKFAVQDLSLAVYPDEILCVVGESGSGKTLTAQAAMGLLAPEVKIATGKIKFEERELFKLSEREFRDLRGRRMAMVFQEPLSALNPVMTIGDQIAEVFRFHGAAGPNLREQVLEILNAVHLPDPSSLIETYPFRLSGGQRQRVVIAIALALKPKLLFADEPTTALDVTTQAQILDLIKELQRERQMAVVYITHDFGVVADIAHRVIVMQHGHIIEEGPTDEVLNRPKEAYTQRLVSAVLKLSSPAQARTADSEALVKVEGLTKTYIARRGFFRPPRIVEAVKNVTFNIRSGETLGLVGESGSGKSTVGRCLVRLIEPDYGKILIGGVDLRELKGESLRRARRRIQMVFQDPYASLNPRRRIGEIVAAGPIAHGVDYETALQRARDLLRLVGLDPSTLMRFPHEFSGGQRQRIGIARALALEPILLIADEPVSSLDVSVQGQILDLLRDLRDRFGLSMLFITHDLRVAARVCDRIAVMHQGVIVESGLTDSVFRRPEHPYTRTLLAAVPGQKWGRIDQPA